MEALEDRLKAEKVILKSDLDRAGVKLIFDKLIKAANLLPLKMIRSKDKEEQLKAQLLYELLTQEVPRIIENIMNSDFELLEKPKPKWSFRRWLKGE